MLGYWLWMGALALILVAALLPFSAQAMFNFPLPVYISQQGLAYPESLISQVEATSIPRGTVFPQIFYNLKFPPQELDLGSTKLKLSISPKLHILTELPGCVAKLDIDRESIVFGLWWASMGGGDKQMFDTSKFPPDAITYFEELLGKNFASRGLYCQDSKTSLELTEPREILNFLLPFADEEEKRALREAYNRDHMPFGKIRLEGDPPPPIVIQSALPKELRVQWTSTDPGPIATTIEVPAWRNGYEKIRVGWATYQCYQKQIELVKEELLRISLHTRWDSKKNTKSVRLDLVMTTDEKIQNEINHDVRFHYLQDYQGKSYDPLPIVTFSLGPNGCQTTPVKHRFN